MVNNCTLASRQVSVLALGYSMKLDGIVRGMKDGGMSMNSLRNTHQFSEP